MYLIPFALKNAYNHRFQNSCKKNIGQNVYPKGKTTNLFNVQFQENVRKLGYNLDI